MDEGNARPRATVLATLVVLFGAACAILVLRQAPSKGPVLYDSPSDAGPRRPGTARPARQPEAGAPPPAAPERETPSDLPPPDRERGPARGEEPRPQGNAVLEGRVLDETGSPIEAAQVAAWSREADGASQAQSDSEGRYRLAGLPPGTYGVWVTAQGFVSPPYDPVAISGTTRHDVVLSRGATVTGWVTEAGNSMGVAGAWVQAYPQERGSREGWGGSGAQAQTDVEGRFSMSGLADGSYRIYWGHEGYLPIPQEKMEEFEVAGGQAAPSDFLFELSPGAAIEGRVFSEDGSAAPGAFVFAFLAGEEKSATQAGEDGAYRLSGLPSGTYDVFARSEDYSRLARLVGLSIAEGIENPGVDLVLSSGARVEGRVLAEGRPAAGVSVEAFGMDGQVHRTGETDADGNYVVPNLYPGTYRITGAAAEDAEGLRPASREIEVHHPGEVIPLDLELILGSSTEGRVLDPSGSPVQGAQVFLLSGQEYVARIVTEEDGRFRVRGLSPGGYDLFVRAGPFEEGGPEYLARDRIELSERETRAGDDIHLSPGAWVSGRVLGPGGRGMPGVRVDLVSKEGGVRRQAATDASGAFRIDTLYDGDYVLTARWGRGEDEFVREKITVRAGRPIEDLAIQAQPGPR
ncbi:MAG: carboxypeptidase regulatory-like domain-containing protein [Planctomycetes bacterium]|nr:carboxypeptidase regulatory-like domain-containing protein [Planctomycetota bacterium]